MPKPDLTVAEVADELGVAAKTINDWIALGRFPHAYKLDPLGRNSHYRIPRGDVEAIKRLRQKAQAGR